MSTVKKGDKVKVHYTGKLESGEVFDSSEGRQPLAFTVGAGMMIAGFDAGVEGMSIGDKKTIRIEPKDGYGESSPENIFEYPLQNFPDTIKPELGMQLSMSDQNGQRFNVVIAEINNDTVKLDANHFLAGKTLIFDIEMMEIE